MGEPDNINIEEESQPQEAAAKPTGFSFGKLLEWFLSNLILIIIGVVISTIIMVIYVRTNISKRSEEIYKTSIISTKPDPWFTFQLDEFKINTADIDEQHFIRVKIILAYNKNNKKLATELPLRKEQIRDIILQILNSKEKQDIDEEIEKIRLKDEIKKAINNVLQSGEIEDVYYDEFVIS